MRRVFWIMAGGTALALASAAPAMAAEPNDCPNGGTVRFGVEPYDTAPKLGPIYEHIGNMISQKLGCDVKIFVATNYNAEIEAMAKMSLAELSATVLFPTTSIPSRWPSAPPECCARRATEGCPD